MSNNEQKPIPTEFTLWLESELDRREATGRRRAIAENIGITVYRKLTESHAHPGDEGENVLRWIKASERLPSNNHEIPIKIIDGSPEMYSVGRLRPGRYDHCFEDVPNGNYYPVDQIEWLEEANPTVPVAQEVEIEKIAEGAYFVKPTNPPAPVEEDRMVICGNCGSRWNIDKEDCPGCYGKIGKRLAAPAQGVPEGKFINGLYCEWKGIYGWVPVDLFDSFKEMKTQLTALQAERDDYRKALEEIAEGRINGRYAHHFELIDLADNALDKHKTPNP